MSEAQKLSPSTYRDGYGVLNPYGGIWSPDVFQSEKDAWASVEAHWPDARSHGYQVALCRQETSLLRPLDPSKENAR